jgi:hypothetical protein
MILCDSTLDNNINGRGFLAISSVPDQPPKMVCSILFEEGSERRFSRELRVFVWNQHAHILLSFG